MLSWPTAMFAMMRRSEAAITSADDLLGQQADQRLLAGNPALQLVFGNRRGAVVDLDVMSGFEFREDRGGDAAGEEDVQCDRLSRLG